eukprot:1136355-Pelagomonas_calceolata.AAC.3
MPLSSGSLATGGGGGMEASDGELEGSLEADAWTLLPPALLSTVSGSGSNRGAAPALRPGWPGMRAGMSPNSSHEGSRGDGPDCEGGHEFQPV